MQVNMPDDQTLCAVCAAPLRQQPDEGCVRGRCSMKPLPKQFYAPSRVCVEYQQIVVFTGTEHGFYGVVEHAQ